MHSNSISATLFTKLKKKLHLTKKDTKGDRLQDLTSYEFNSFFDNREIALSLK